MKLLDEIYCDIVAILSRGASGKLSRTLLVNELRSIRNRLEPLVSAKAKEKAARMASKFGNTD